ncbi:SpoIIE family protein phosphatase [Streptomyces europaeiscabiei]|uniref:SpoIIE family protein phosphatase n=7 Tax=Streptomyces europaeiscabiei TaxID=146819 RepID=A0ABU4NKP2_9ACTN|nr:SpoIIE family protein phosphatase [Streptomyces europaeiscabiei]MDX3545121.1 SpoIIE family protein phosphatase [Streptomyces europaeiscabiei]MDX3554809.1 SpoIIE family protein phosphatase [Streptomyces europaeiscabiei]MDX3702289.1 SpoIIE family protein phosphatase [Streptomyces europaeiscabiei]MDX3841456.1 SpoIIE family protein phosphatase [Streptomyces europaeiscabiei]
MGTDRDSAVSRQRFDVADAAPLLIDADGFVTSWTQDAERLFGYPAAEILGRSVCTLLVDEDGDRIGSLTESHRLLGSWSGILTARHRDGHRVRVMVRVVPTREATAAAASADPDRSADATTSPSAPGAWPAPRPGYPDAPRPATPPPPPPPSPSRSASPTPPPPEGGRAPAREAGTWPAVGNTGSPARQSPPPPKPAPPRTASPPAASPLAASPQTSSPAPRATPRPPAPGTGRASARGHGTWPAAQGPGEPVARVTTPAPDLPPPPPSPSARLPFSPSAASPPRPSPSPSSPASPSLSSPQPPSLPPSSPPSSPSAPSSRDPLKAAHWVALVSDATQAPGWDMSRTVLERMTAWSPVGIAIVDTELRFVWSNAALERFGGGRAHERVGLRLAEVQPGLDAERIEAQMRQVLETGSPVLDYEHVGRIRSAPHRETAHAMSFTRLEDDHGRPIGVYYTVVDVSEQHRARIRLALLDRAGEQIGRTLDVRRTAQELADVVVPTLADFVTVDLLDSVLRGAEPGPLGDGSVPLRRTAQQSVHAGVPEAVLEIGAVASYTAGSPPVRVLVEGRSWSEPRLDPLSGEWAEAVPGHRTVPAEALGLHSVMIVPVRARGITLGITTFFRRDRQDPFDAVDLGLAEELVGRAAVCVDNARRYTRERDAALALQRSLLPRRLPEQDAAEVAVRYRPADELTGLGGDWYDVIPLSGARVALVIGEVAGHGIDGAAAMGRLRTAVRTLADLDLPPDEVLAHLDDMVAKSARQEGSEPGGGSVQTVGARCLYVVHDPVSGTCAMAAAGPFAPALVAPDGTVTFPELPEGPALGVDQQPFQALQLDLAEGTVIALHTDGLIAEASREALCRALARPEPLLERHAQRVLDSLSPAHPTDDVALLLARTRRLPAHRVASWELPADPALVAEARKTTARQLGAWGLEELAFTTELVVSELVTNAIRHAAGPIRLRLILERTLVCEVFDGGATAPHLRHPRTTDEGGRGLFLISQFTQRWGTRFLPEGKVIWAEQSLTDPPA